MPTFYIRASMMDEAVVKVEAPDADAARLAAADWFIDEIRGQKTYLTDVDTADLDEQAFDEWGGTNAIVVRTKPDSKPGDYHGYELAYDDEDPLTDEERERRDVLNLAMENNPGLAFTASDMEDN